MFIEEKLPVKPHQFALTEHGDHMLSLFTMKSKLTYIIRDAIDIMPGNSVEME